MFTTLKEIMDTASINFQARIVIWDGLIQEIEVFTWEVEQFDDNKRTGREWVRDYLSETDVSELSRWLEWGDLEDEAYESVFRGLIYSVYSGPDMEYDDEMVIDEHLTARCPDAKRYFE